MRILSNVNILGTLDLDNVQNAAADTDRFLVQDANGVVKFRTGAEVASDIGASVGFVSTVKHEVKLGEAIATGQAVYVTSADGTNMIVSKASNGSDATSSKTLGLLETGGITNDIRYVITEGLLAGLDTSTAVAGDPVWLGTNGNLLFGTANKPVAPAHMVFIGIVTRVQSNNGEIFVKVQNGFELEELHNVSITAPLVDKAVIQYDTASGLWKNSALGGVTGTGASGQVAFWNSANTQTGSNNLFWDATNSRLGIGTNAPTSRLYVTSQGINSTFDSGAAADARLEFRRSGTRIGYLNWDSGVVTLQADSGNYLGLNAGGSERVRILAGGNVHVGGTSDNGLRFQVTGDGYFSGSVGIGTSTGLTDINLRITKALAGSVFPTSISVAGTIAQAATTGAVYVQTSAITEAAAFTLPNLYHFRSTQGTFGAGSTVTNQYGYIAESSLIGATNNYGFYGNIASGTGRWNLYMNGTANNYLAGSLGIGTTSLTGNNLAVIKNITGTTTAFNIQSAGVIQSDVTGYASYYRAVASTQATTFTLSTLANFSSGTGAFGAGSTTTNFIGFHAQPMTGGVNNYGFYGEVASGTGRWNLYMVGSAHNYLANNLGINNTTPLTKLHISAGHIFANNGTGVNGGANIYLGSNDFNNSTFWDSAPGIGAVYSATSGVASDLGFYTYAGNANSRTERARIFYTGNIGINTTTDAGFRLDVNGTMRVSGASTFSGSVGIGISPAAKLDILATASDDIIALRYPTLGKVAGVYLDSANVYYGAGANNFTNAFVAGHTTNVLTLRTAGTVRATLDASGNLGLGVTPSAWWSSAKVIQVGTIGSLWSGSGLTNVSHNYYFNGSQSFYLTSAHASAYQQTSGQHIWYNAPSGTAGTAVSFTQAMTLFATGNLAVGTTTDAGYKLDVNGVIRSFTGTGTGKIELGTGAIYTGVIDYSAVNGLWYFNNRTAAASSATDYFQFQADGAAILTLKKSGAATFSSSVTAANLYSTGASNFATSSGNVGIGTSSPSQKLTVSAAAALVDIISTTSTQFNGLEFKNGGGSFYIGQDSSTGAFYGSTLPYAASLYVSGNYPMTFFTNGSLRMTLSNTGNFGIGMSPSYKLDVTGEARVSNAIAIGTTPDTNKPFKILKNINGTVGINFENTSTGSLAFSAIQMGTDVSGGTAFTNLVYSSSGVTAAGVYQPSGTSLINTGSGGLNFLSVSQPIRFFTSTGNGTERVRIKNEGQVHFVPLAAAPTTSVQAGDVYYDSTLAKLRCYDGIQWQDLF